MRRTTGEECECLSMKAHDKSVSSGGKLTSRSWMAGQGLNDGTSKYGLLKSPLCPWLVHLARQNIVNLLT